MVVQKILNLLRNNAVLTSLVDNRIEPFAVKGFSNGIVYTFTPLTDDSIKRTDRLEIHIIADSVETMFAIDKEVRQTLLTTGDEPLADGIYKVEMNGGGTLEDAATATKHLITYYYVVSNGGIKDNG